MPDHDPTEDQATRYVLGELDERERAAFEAQLAGSADLRASVQELELACEALALSAPQRQAPKRVWARVAARARGTAARERESAMAWSWADLARLLRRSGWAVAACLAIGWAFYALLSGNQALSGRNLSGGPTLTDGSATEQERLALPRTGHAPEHDLTVPLAGVSPGPEAGASEGPAREEARQLRSRLQQLSDQFADVNRLLTQQVVLPPGAGRFQVFELVPTNAPATQLVADAATDARNNPATHPKRLEDMLRSALSYYVAALNESAHGQPVENRETGPAASAATDTGTLTLGSTAATASQFQVVELNDLGSEPATSGNTDAPTGAPARTTTEPLAAQTSALGFYSPDTGRGSISFISAEPLGVDQSYQFWVFEGPGTPYISLGTTSSQSSRFIVNFAIDSGHITNPGFLITLEPKGGSPTPSGPIVVRPPVTPGTNP